MAEGVRAEGGLTNGSANGRETILEVRNLRVFYGTSAGAVHAVDDVSFDIRKGERFGLVGESGCGKSSAINAILRLIRPPGWIESGEVRLGGRNLLALSEEQMRQVRWNQVSLVMQGAMNSLNPIMRIRDQIADVIVAHSEHPPGGDAMSRRIEALVGTVGLPGRAARLFPHELSGGMKQRACIAMAMCLEPDLIIADEPTSALDVVVQRVVAQTLIEVEARLGASLLLIGHDMGLQAQLVDRLGVMYAGKIAEIGDVRTMFKRPLHPYTQLLTSSLPSVKRKTIPRGIPGLPPTLINPPPGCMFHPRCPYAKDVCRQVTPELRELEPDHFVACHLY